MIAALVPAAGLSRRMGQPKLTMTLGGISVAARVVAALLEGGVDLVAVVAPPRDAPGSVELQAEVARAGGIAVIPDTQPPDMRASFECGLTWLELLSAPPTTVVLTPADSPALSFRHVALVVEQARAFPDAIVVPTHQGQRGHPIALPWPIALQVRGLPMDVGVNALIRGLADRAREISVDDPAILEDLDTRQDYERWVAREGR